MTKHKTNTTTKTKTKPQPGPDQKQWKLKTRKRQNYFDIGHKDQQLKQDEIKAKTWWRLGLRQRPRPGQGSKPTQQKKLNLSKLNLPHQNSTQTYS